MTTRLLSYFLLLIAVTATVYATIQMFIGDSLELPCLVAAVCVLAFLTAYHS